MTENKQYEYVYVRSEIRRANSYAVSTFFCGNVDLYAEIDENVRDVRRERVCVCVSSA